MREFDYYIFIDFSENLIGHCVIENKKLKELLPKISKFSHYRELKYKKAYIHSITKVIQKNKILDYFAKHKIREMRENMTIYLEVFEFINSHSNCIIFISIDDSEYPNFEKFVKIADKSKTTIRQESKLIKNSPVYRISLVLDTLLNIERIKRKNGR